MNSLKKRFAVIGVCVGAIAVIAGLLFIASAPYGGSTSSSAKFGTDFYTYLYGATVNNGAILTAIYARIGTCVGWLLVFLGATDICYFGYRLGFKTVDELKTALASPNDKSPDKPSKDSEESEGSTKHGANIAADPVKPDIK